MAYTTTVAFTVLLAIKCTIPTGKIKLFMRFKAERLRRLRKQLSTIARFREIKQLTASYSGKSPVVDVLHGAMGLTRISSLQRRQTTSLHASGQLKTFHTLPDTFES